MISRPQSLKKAPASEQQAQTSMDALQLLAQEYVPKKTQWLEKLSLCRGEAFGETGGPFTFGLLGVAGGSCLTLAAGLFEGLGAMAKAAFFC